MLGVPKDQIGLGLVKGLFKWFSILYSSDLESSTKKRSNSQNDFGTSSSIRHHSISGCFTNPYWQGNFPLGQKKKRFVSGFQPTLFFGADPKLFFQLSNENSKKEKKNGKKIIKIRWTVQKLQAIAEIAL